MYQKVYFVHVNPSTFLIGLTYPVMDVSCFLCLDILRIMLRKRHEGAIQ